MPETAACNCIELINRLLEEKNAQLDVSLILDLKTGEPRPPMLHAHVVKIDANKRGPLPAIFFRFCPFCGKEYPRA